MDPFYGDYPEEFVEEELIPGFDRDFDLGGFDGSGYDEGFPQGRYYEDGGELPGGFWHVEEYHYP